MMTHMFGIGFLCFLLPLILVVGGIKVLVWLGRSGRLSHRRASSPERLDLPGSRSSDQVEAGIYRLAKRLGGRLTVSDTVVETGLSAGEAERILQAMTDGVRVSMEVDERGVVGYEFREMTRGEPT